MPAVDLRLFITLPVADPAAAAAFYGRLGFACDERFSDRSAACVVVTGPACLMLTPAGRTGAAAVQGPGIPAGPGPPAAFSLSAPDRASVDRIADAAAAAGAAMGGPPVDLGFSYRRAFCDPDGHAWEVVWASPAVLEAEDA